MTVRTTNSHQLDSARVRTARHALSHIQTTGHAVLAPSNPDMFVHVHAACRQLGLPIVLGGPRHQRAAFTAIDRIAIAHPAGHDTAGVEIAAFAADAPADTAALATSSGTSGTARYSLWSRASLDYQLRATSERLGTEPRTRYGLALSPTSSYGFSVVNLAYAGGCAPIMFSPTAFSSITAALIAGELTTLDTIPGVWRYLASAMREDTAISNAVRRLDVRGVGGEVVPRALVETYLDAGAPLHNGYGLTEAGPNVAISYGEGYREHTVGTPLHGTDVRVSPDGDIEVRSPSVSTRAWDPGTGRIIPAADVSGEGWLRTRDVGRIDETGTLIVVGRSDGTLVGNGAKLHSSVLEDRLRDVSGDVVAVTAMQVDPYGRGAPRLVVTLVAGPGTRILEPHVAAYRERIRLFPSEFRVRDVVSIEQQHVPVTAAGKFDRRGLTQIVSDYLGGKEVSPCTRVF